MLLALKILEQPLIAGTVVPVVVGFPLSLQIAT
jgi:hypothetical protein